MNQKLIYETPELEITKFDTQISIMSDFSETKGDGDIVTNPYDSNVETDTKFEDISWFD